jgi:O-antigen ligase
MNLEGMAGLRTTIVPAWLFAALALPICAVLLLEPYLLPMTLFVVVSVPLAAGLYLAGLLVQPRSLVLAGAVLFAAGLIMSTIVADRIGFPAFRTQLLRGLGIVWFMYLLALVPLLERKWLTTLVLLFVLVCGASAAINIGFYLAGDPRAFNADTPRFVPVIGMSRHRWPTTISATYAIMIAAAFALFVSAFRGVWIRVAIAAAALAMAVALALTESRGGYLGALLGILAVAAVLSRRMLLAVLAAIATLVVFVLAYPPALEAILARGGSYRLGVWLRYISFGMEHPLVGTGVSRRLYLTVDGAELHHAHNLLISAQIRGGIIALAGMALMVLAGLYWSWRHARRSGDPLVFAMMVALFVAGIFDYDLILTPMDWVWFTMWLPIGLAAGCEIAGRRAAAALTTSSPTR